MKHHGEDHNAQPPHDAEGSIDNTAAAHQDSGGDVAEDRLSDISQERSDKEQPYELMERTAVGEDGWSCLAGTCFCSGDGVGLSRSAFRRCSGMGLSHSSFNSGKNGARQSVGNLLHSLGQLFHAGVVFLYLEDHTEYADKIHGQDDETGDEDNLSGQRWNPADDHMDQWMNKTESKRRSHAPKG